MITLEQVVRAAWENYAEEYAAGATVAEISRRSQMSPSAVRDQMKKAGVYEPGRKPGSKPLKFCQRGHDMAIHAKPISHKPGAGTYCSECKRLRERKGSR